MAKASFDSLQELGEEMRGSVRENRPTRNRNSFSASLDSTDHLPVLTCLAPGCKNTFRIPWGYYEDNRPGTKKSVWSGVCGVGCSLVLEELAKEKSRAQEEALLKRSGLA